MLKSLKIKILILLISIIIIGGYLYINTIIGSGKYQKLILLLNEEQKKLILKYVFPYKLISQQEQIISYQQKIITQQKQILEKPNDLIRLLDLSNL